MVSESKSEQPKQQLSKAARAIAREIRKRGEKARTTGRRVGGLKSLAEELGKYPSVVSRWSNGERRPDADGVQLCWRVLGLSPELWTQY